MTKGSANRTANDFPVNLDASTPQADFAKGFFLTHPVFHLLFGGISW